MNIRISNRTRRPRRLDLPGAMILASVAPPEARGSRIIGACSWPTTGTWKAASSAFTVNADVPSPGHRIVTGRADHQRPLSRLQPLRDLDHPNGATWPRTCPATIRLSRSRSSRSTPAARSPCSPPSRPGRRWTCAGSTHQTWPRCDRSQPRQDRRLSIRCGDSQPHPGGTGGFGQFLHLSGGAPEPAVLYVNDSAPDGRSARTTSLRRNAHLARLGTDRLVYAWSWP